MVGEMFTIKKNVKSDTRAQKDKDLSLYSNIFSSGVWYRNNIKSNLN